MHKSILTFGLLAGSLVMLVIMPVLNQNNSFFNVLAQEYNSNEDYNNNYNDYQDNDMYSKYPTESNKYECQKGPFEGFFVSSVEFCKKIPIIDNSDKRNNGGGNGTIGEQGPPGPVGPIGPVGPPGPTGAQGETGPAGQQGIPGVSGPPGPRGLSGPAGPQGIQGPIGLSGPAGANSTIPGPAGPAGPNSISPSTLYRVFGPIVTTGDSPGSFNRTEAECNPGDTVLSGGPIIRPLSLESYVTGGNSLSESDNASWIIIGQGPLLEIQSFCLCFNNP
jgi:hypothetical protein